MAHVITLYEYDDYGASVLNSVALAGYVNSWTPSSPKAGDESLVESIELINVSLTDWEKIETLLSRARMRSMTGQGYPIYMEYSPGNNAAADYRAEVFDGQVLTKESNLKQDWANSAFDGTLIFSRSPYWEMINADIPVMTNLNGTGYTATPIYNCNDGSGTAPNKRCNYLNISVPSGRRLIDYCPVRVELIFTTSVSHVGQITIGMINDTQFAHNLEAAGGTSVADANSSGGYLRRHALSSTMTVLETWDLASLTGGLGFPILEYKHGNFMVAARFANDPPANTYVQIQMGRSEYAGPVVKLTASKYQILDVIQIPPGTRNSSFEKDLTLSAKGSGNLDIDFITLIPADAYIKIPEQFRAVSNNDMYVYDASEGYAYFQTAAGMRYQLPFTGPGLSLKNSDYSGGDTKLVMCYATGSDGTEMEITGRFLILIRARYRVWTL